MSGATGSGFPRLEPLEARELLASRLFALPLHEPNVIAELNPQTGAEINRFPGPTTTFQNAESGLAFDGQSLYYMTNDGTNRLWMLNPDTGDVIKSETVGLTPVYTSYDGLGVVGGKVYLQDQANHQLVVMDSTTLDELDRFNVAANLVGGLTGADSPDELIATESLTTAVKIDPESGDVLGRFWLPDAIYGVASVDDKYYFGSANGNQIYITDRTGNWLTTLNTPYPVAALGSDGTAPSQPPTTPSVEQVVNGGFEQGNLTGWETYILPGSQSNGFHAYSGADPFGRPLPAPSAGTFAATNDLFGPSTTFLYQDITLPANQTADLSMMVGYNNLAGQFFAPQTLDFSLNLNQQFRIDIVDPQADLLSVDPEAVLLPVFQTRAGDPNTLAPTNVQADLSSFAGRTIRLRIAIASNMSYLDTIIDSVSIQTSQVSSPPLSSGTYYIADFESIGEGTGRIIQVDGATGAQTVVSSGGLFINPIAVTVALDGSLIVADRGELGGTGTIFRVDPVTGAQTVISTGGLLVDPVGLAIDLNGMIHVADRDSNLTGRILTIDPSTGAQFIHALGGSLNTPLALATYRSSTYVVDDGANINDPGQLVLLDSSPGYQSTYPTDGLLNRPAGVLFLPGGDLIISDMDSLGGQGAIFRYDPIALTITVISQGGLFRDPAGITLTPDGNLVVMDAGALEGQGALILVDMATGGQAVLSSGGLFQNPNGVAFRAKPFLPGPVADAGGPYYANEGGVVTLDAWWSRDPDQENNTLTYLWDLNGNGIYGETLSTPNGYEVGMNAQFDTLGMAPGTSREISLKVIDATGYSSTATATIHINIPPPVVTINPSATVLVGETFTVTGAYTGFYPNSDYEAVVSFGDSSQGSILPLNPDRTFQASHVYTQPGTYEVRVSVHDAWSMSGTWSSILVTVVQPSISFHSLSDQIITYGHNTVTLGGQIDATIGSPQGVVAVSLAGVTQYATIDPLTGAFATVFSTASLGVQNTPYTITYAYAGDVTFPHTTDTSHTVTVLPRELIVTASNTTKVYGDVLPALSGTVEGVQNNDLIFATYSTSANLGSPIGLYSITASLSGSALHNYTITYVDGQLTINKASLRVTANYMAKAYGAPIPTLVGTIEGIRNNDPISVTYSTLATSTSSVGVYAITASLSGDALDNYSVEYVDGQLVITKAKLRVTANDGSRVYGDANPTLGGIIEGIRNNDSISAIFSTAADSSSSTGLYPITATLTGDALDNYSVSYIDGQLEVTKASLRVIANNASKVYGDANPVLSGRIEGIRNQDNITADYLTLATATSPVGTYDIVPTLADPGGKLSNYAWEVVNGELTINRAPLLISANNLTMLYGEAVPPLTAEFSGFVLGEDPSILGGHLDLSTTATSASPLGSYAITVGGVSSENYAITFLPGTLTIASWTMREGRLVVSGTSANDIIGVFPTSDADHWLIAISTPSQGSSYTVVPAPANGLVIHGNAGDDFITVSPSISQRAFLYGDAGADTLVAGGGPNVLAGGTGNDRLIGGSSRGIQIGGLNEDVLIASSNEGQQILIGGHTTYDDNLNALDALLDEWTTGSSLNQRIASLKGGVGPNAIYSLNDSHVLNDSAVDVLGGKSKQQLVPPHQRSAQASIQRRGALWQFAASGPGFITNGTEQPARNGTASGESRVKGRRTRASPGEQRARPDQAGLGAKIRDSLSEVTEGVPSPSFAPNFSCP